MFFNILPENNYIHSGIFVPLQEEKKLLDAVEESQNELLELKNQLLTKKNQVASAKAELNQKSQALQNINK